MKTKILSILALLLMTVTQGAWAQETLTVFDGDASNQYIPMYGYSFDYYTKSECIIPASELTAMEGGTITAITFYANALEGSNSTFGTANQKVFLKEVSETTLSSYSGMDGATVVFDGTLPMPTTSTDGYTITFSQGYTYNGGNLLIGIYNAAKGSWKKVFWYGNNNQSSGVSAFGYSGNSLASVAFKAQTFLPKTTFTYTEPATYTVSLKSGTDDATSWQGKAGEGEYQALPLEGVAAGTAVSVKYSGTKMVKSVKAVKAAPANVPVESITLNKTATEIAVGQTETLSVTEVLPANATDPTYTWKSSDETKATVDQDGKVTAVAAGTVNIYAEANDGSGVQGTCAVTVKNATLLSLTVSDPDNWIDGNSKTIYYLAGETWRQAIENHAKENAGWIIIKVEAEFYITFTGYTGMATVMDNSDYYPIDSTVIDGTRSYIFAE